MFCHTPWCVLCSVLFHFRLVLWLMRIKELIRPHRKHRNLLIHTGKDLDLSPISSSLQLWISSYSDTDMLKHSFVNKWLLHTATAAVWILSFFMSYQPLNTHAICPRMECIGDHVIQWTTVCFQDWVKNRTFLFQRNKNRIDIYSFGAQDLISVLLFKCF